MNSNRRRTIPVLNRLGKSELLNKLGKCEFKFFVINHSGVSELKSCIILQERTQN